MWHTLGVVGCLTFGIVGCGGASGPPKAKLYPVSGKVMVNGKPLTGCSIVFSTATPAAGASAGYSGELDSDGNFTLSDPEDGRKGAAVGKYKVTFTVSPEAAKEAMMKSSGRGAGPGYEATSAPFPKKYASAKTSPKQVEVKAEDNVINIEL